MKIVTVIAYEALNQAKIKALSGYKSQDTLAIEV